MMGETVLENPVLQNKIKAEDIASQEKKSIRVLVSIPNEGHSPVEAYANRLVNMLHLGKLEERSKFLKLIDKYVPESNNKEELLKEFWNGNKPSYQKEFDGKIFDFYFFTLGRILTPLAREEAAKEAIKGDFDYLFMIDDDMICPDDLFERLYKNDVDIIAPLAFTRNPPYSPVAYTNTEYWDTQNHKYGFINDVIRNYPKDQLFRCDAVGFGAVLIKVEVLKKMKESYDKLFMSTVSTGEDILFCYNATKIGAKVYMDSRVKLGHLSHPLQVTEDYAKFYWAHNNLEIEKKNGAYLKYENLKNKVLLGN